MDEFGIRLWQAKKQGDPVTKAIEKLGIEEDKHMLRSEFAAELFGVQGDGHAQSHSGVTKVLSIRPMTSIPPPTPPQILSVSSGAPRGIVFPPNVL